MATTIVETVTKKNATNAITKWEMDSKYTEYRHSVGDGEPTYYIYDDYAALVEVNWDWFMTLLFRNNQ